MLSPLQWPLFNLPLELKTPQSPSGPCSFPGAFVGLLWCAFSFVWVPQQESCSLQLKGQLGGLALLCRSVEKDLSNPGDNQPLFFLIKRDCHSAQMWLRGWLLLQPPALWLPGGFGIQFPSSHSLLEIKPLLLHKPGFVFSSRNRTITQTRNDMVWKLEDNQIILSGRRS